MGAEFRNPALPDGVYAWRQTPGDAMWDDLLALVVGVIFIPIIVVFGLFRLAALKRPGGLKRSNQVEEWLASEELHSPK